MFAAFLKQINYYITMMRSLKQINYYIPNQEFNQPRTTFTGCSFYVGTRTAEWLVTKHEIPVDLKFYNSPKGVLHSLSKTTAVNKKRKPFAKGKLVSFRSCVIIPILHNLGCGKMCWLGESKVLPTLYSLSMQHIRYNIKLLISYYSITF